MSLETLKREWTLAQNQMAHRVVKRDTFSTVKHIAGLDVTFVQDKSENLHTTIGIGSIAVLSIETMNVVYKNYHVLATDVPYVPTFLGFREIEFAKYLLNHLKTENPHIYPELVMVDGSGYYHPRRCGSASQVGIELSVPTIGVCKTYMALDDLRNASFDVLRGEETVFLEGESGEVYGAALYNGTSKHPLYVSVGHMVSLESAIRYTRRMMVHKIPEPIRHADLYSREIARQLAGLRL